MKKLPILALAGAGIMIAGSASAIDSTGCGLGSMAWRGQSGIAPQVLAVTTNTSFGTQTFGITFGTSGCDPNGRVTGGTQKMVFTFLENNMEQYALDASRGEGETLDTLAGILNMDTKEFAAKSQQNFAALFPDDNVDAVYVTQQIFAMLKA
ncbi:MAG: DUF3015 family protein [Alphaproteobacteria bacterium]|nr:DUF3015 family protein [Alphaproteobacteria bacterium]